MLAELTGMSPSAITQFELGQARPSADSLARLSMHLGLPASYFTVGRPIVPLAVSEVHFRSLRATRLPERQQALATMSHFAELVIVMSRAVRLPSLGLPVFHRTVPSLNSADDVPEAAARALRKSWELSPGPLPHLLRQIEMHGIAVAVARFGSSAHIDAFSSQTAKLERPVICLSSDRGNILRRRFSAAHELGHLIMHPCPDPGNPTHEREADRFAAELLMPAADISALLPRRLDLPRLVDLQQQWGVSVQALLRRCLELKTVSQSTYKRGMIAITDLGWRRDEPAVDYQGEWPAMLAAALDLARPRGINEQVLSAGLHIPQAEIADLLGFPDEQRPALRLVVSDHEAAGAKSLGRTSQARNPDSDSKDSPSLQGLTSSEGATGLARCQVRCA